MPLTAPFDTSSLIPDLTAATKLLTEGHQLETKQLSSTMSQMQESANNLSNNFISTQ